MAEGQCLFCVVASGQIPSKKVYEDAETMAFLDINPRNKGHTLVITKKHYETLMDMPEGEAERLFGIVRKVAIAARDAVDAGGINIGQNNGKMAGQMIPHVHFHVIPRFETDKVKVGAEALLPPIKLEEAEMNKIAKDIRETIGAPEPKKVQKKPVKREEPQKEETETEEAEEDEGFKKIDFDF